MAVFRSYNTSTPIIKHPKKAKEKTIKQQAKKVKKKNGTSK